MNRCRTAAIVPLVLLALIGCGVPTDDTPRQITPPRGPYQALIPAAPPAIGPGTVTEQLYLVRDGKLVPVGRRVRTAPTIETQLRDLLAGPTDADRDAALTSALTGTNITGSRLAGGTVTVEIGNNLADSGRNDQVLAFGQIVCTLTGRPDVTTVSFLHNGQRLGIPRADGSLSQGPLTAADYASLIASA